MFEIRVVVPDKIIAARGKRSRREIVENSGHKFTEQDLYNWEKGLNMPRQDKQPYLLKGLGVSFEDISEAVSADLAV